jgi:hypothetical protein
MIPEKGPPKKTAVFTFYFIQNKKLYITSSEKKHFFSRGDKTFYIINNKINIL